MTVPDSGDAGQIPAPDVREGPHVPRHAAPSASGIYQPPHDDAEQVTAVIPRVGPDQVVGELAGAVADIASMASEPVLTDADVPRPADEPGPAGRHSAAGPSALRLVWIYPDLLSTYGDRGNLITLERRARLRGLAVEPIQVNSDQPVPQQGDIYLIAGGEDLPQVLAARRLRADGGLAAAAERGAVVFAVCAGYQVIGSVFGGAQGEPVDGLGILDLHSGRGERRGVGEVVADVDAELGVGRLSGFENHQGVTTLGPGIKPLARVVLGTGNGDGTEGAYAGRVLGTYLHGPVLVRNPALADFLLTWVVGALPPLTEAQETWTTRLRAERLAAVSA